MKRWLKEPLFHFLLIGLALFGLNALRDRNERQTSEIRITEGRIQSLAETFGRQWNRPPSEDELAGLVNDFVREEVLMREALALGLDQDDVIVRRRLAQKMEFLSEDAASVMTPTEADLKAYLTAHRETFMVPPRYTFDQIALDPTKREKAEIATLVAALEAGRLDPVEQNEIRMLDVHLEDVSETEIATQFGPEFAKQLATVPLDRWQGPVISGYGWHLVHIATRVPGRHPPLEEVREAVVREWSASKRQEMKGAHIQALLARYKVTIEASPPEDSTAEAIEP